VSRQSLGELVLQAKRLRIMPGFYEGKAHYTMVIEDGKLALVTTTKEDFEGVKRSRLEAINQAKAEK